MSISKQIDEMIRTLEFSDADLALIAKAILLHAKMERECTNEVVAAIDEMTKELRGK